MEKKITLNNDKEVLNFLRKLEKEGKVACVIHNEYIIAVDVNWSHCFEGGKNERRKFIRLLTISNFKYQPDVCVYVREKDWLFESKRAESLTNFYKEVKNKMLSP
jgi:hypothetical protein